MSSFLEFSHRTKWQEYWDVSWQSYSMIEEWVPTDCSSDRLGNGHSSTAVTPPALTRCGVCDMNFENPMDHQVGLARRRWEIIEYLIQIHVLADHIVMRDGHDFACPRPNCDKVSFRDVVYNRYNFEKLRIRVSRVIDCTQLGFTSLLLFTSLNFAGVPRSRRSPYAHTRSFP